MASIRDHRGKYQVRYRVAGRMRSKSFSRLADARRFANAVEADIARGEYLDPRAGRSPFAEYANRWMDLRADRARSTLDRDWSYLTAMILPAFGDQSVGSVRPTDIEAWLATLDRAPATKSKALGIVRQVFRLAVRDQAIRSNPAADVAAPRQDGRELRGRALSDGELQAVIAAAEHVDPSTAAMVWLMGRCGLRIGEADAVRRQDVDLERRQISVTRSMSRSEGIRPVKGRRSDDKGRTLPMPLDVHGRLTKHIESSPVLSIDRLMFTTPSGRAIEYHNWRTRKWIPIVNRAGIGPVRPHDLRHTVATRLIVVDRWSPAEVQVFLGHRDPRVTLAIYTHVMDDQLPTPSAISQIDV